MANTFSSTFNFCIECQILLGSISYKVSRQRGHSATPKFDGVDKFKFHNLNLPHAAPKTGMDRLATLLEGAGYQNFEHEFQTLLYCFHLDNRLYNFFLLIKQSSLAGSYIRPYMTLRKTQLYPGRGHMTLILKIKNRRRTYLR